MKQYFGKYRGRVESNRDPERRGRLQVSVPAVLGEGRSSWAMPCVPYAGPGVGLFALPPDGARVWVEFEAGDLDHPIWSGCFWGEGEVPVEPAVASAKVLRTDTVTLTLDDDPSSGGVTLETTSGMRLAMTSSGVEVRNASGATIVLEGNRVTVNDGALEVS